MLDPKLIRSQLNDVAAAMQKRNITLDVAKLNSLEEQRKQLQTTIQEMQNERNVRSKEVGIAKSTGKNVDEALVKLKTHTDTLAAKEREFDELQTQLNDLLARIPNIPHSSVPVGKSEADNQVVRKWGEPAKFNFTPKDHVELGARNRWMDFETGSKLSGARFVVLRGQLARLQRALIQFMLDLHTREHGYQEIYVPSIVNAECLYGTGQLPNLKEDLFAVSGDHEAYLIPTSEVPVTNTIRDEIINEDQLPLKFTCYSSCFRSEAGSYGKDLKGMIRNHQFEKVEILQFVHPEKSYEVLEELTKHAETVLQKLELPYQVLALCTADLGFSSAKTYDLEVWLPGQQKYREISSCSNFESFQARRLKARYRDSKTGKPELLHTLNGSGLAVGRTLIAILENYQDEQGRIRIPRVLQPFMDGIEVI